MSNDLSRKRSRETTHPDNPRSLPPTDHPTKLQKLRQDHRFTPSLKEKAIMTPRMQREQYQQQVEAHFQAQEASTKEMKLLAERKGITSGEIALGKRVPRRYQKGLGAGHEEAEAYLQKHVKSRIDQQLVRDVVQGTKEETRVPIQKAVQKYKELLGDDARSSQRDAEPEYHQGVSSSSRAASSSQSDSGSEDDDAGSSSHNAGYSLDKYPQYKQHSTSDSRAPSQAVKRESILFSYFKDEAYAPAIPGKSLAMVSGYSGSCVYTASLRLLRDQGKKDIRNTKVAAEILYYGEGNASPLAIKAVLDKFGKIPYVIISSDDTSINTLRKILDTCGHSLVAAVHNPGKPHHVVLIDKITDTDVYMRNGPHFSVIPRSILEEAAHGYLVPALARELGLV